jgi:Leucine-rich repeat (LRR) protein
MQLPAVQQLNLRRNQLAYLPAPASAAGAFASAKSLQMLDLSYNRIADLSLSLPALSSFGLLSELRLAGNVELSGLPRLSSTTWPHLSSVDLSQCG